MTMTTKYEAHDATGKRHTRTTVGRTYTHCVVVHIPGYTSKLTGTWMPARDQTSWAGSLALAQKEARRRANGEVTIEILEAQVIGDKR
jgi:hypothetical protein